MKIIRLFCLLLALLLAIPLPVGAASAQQGADTLDAMVPLQSQQLEGTTAQAVVLYELGSDTMVYGWQPDTPVDPSGMNKIITALLAIELGNPESVVTVTRNALNSVQIGAMSAGLKVEEQITLRDLLYCMMVGSANDAAAVIAEHISGSQENFVVLMNQRAVELGCTNTVFMNANGLSCEGQHTTARDLAKITKAALEQEFFVELFTAINYTVPATNKSEERELKTTNYMMSKESVRTEFDERVTGGKTGALSTTDRSLICTAEQGSLRYLSVVMSAKGTVNGNAVTGFGNFADTEKLLDHVFGNYTVRQLLYAGQVMEQFSVSGGQNDIVGCASADLYSALPLELVPEDVTLRFMPEELAAPIAKDQKIGTVQVWYQDLCVGQCDMLAVYAVKEAGADLTLMPTAQETAKRTWITALLIGGIAFLAVVLIFVLVLVIRRRIILKKIARRRKLIQEG